MTGTIHRIGRPVKRAATALGAALGLCIGLASANAQAPTIRETPPFFDLSRKPDRVDLGGIRAIRFLTDDDYPPFHFPGPDGQLTGFNVDLARAICEELKVACTIQARRWDTLIPSLEDNRGDAVIASLNSSGSARTRVDFGIPYYRTPARFVMRKDGGLQSTTPAAFKDKTILVVAGSTHEVFLSAFYPGAKVTKAPDAEEALKRLVNGEADALFGDGVTLALWLNGQIGATCCRFLGGGYYESRFFGDGAAIAFRKDSVQLRRAVDHALIRLVERGVYQNLMLKYFPVSFY